MPEPVTSSRSKENEEHSFRRLESFGRLWAGHRTLFWGVHSIWALIAGAGVIFLARRSYGFGRWVMRSLEDRVRLAQTVLDFARAIRERKLQEA